MHRVRSKEGFTLVELMVVVALIGVLTTVAIPNFMEYQARSRRSEGFANLSAIARVQKTYAATNGEYFDSSGLPWPDYTAAPYGELGAHKMRWDAASEAGWGGLGWRPEGDVYYSYQSNVCDEDEDCADGLCFTASAYGDVDADGEVSALMYVEPKLGTDGSLLAECPSGMGGELDFGTPMGPGGKIFSEVAVQRSTDEY
jgi:prepilin-type N-terminal cleavage/methylation domain-containing protein